MYHLKLVCWFPYSWLFSVFSVKAIYVDYSQRKDWNPNFVDRELIEQIDEHTFIERIGFKATGADSRDFCLFCCTENTDSSFLDAQQSIEDERVPARKGFVRATSYFTGTLFEKISDTQTKMYYAGQIDIAGMVPGFIANVVTVNQPMCIASLRTYALSKK